MNKKLILILIIALFIRLFTFSGFSGAPDELINVRIIHQITQGSWPNYKAGPITASFLVRIGFLGVMAGLAKLIGFSGNSLILYPLFCSILTVLLVYYLAKRWINEPGAFWAAFLFAIFPLDVIFSTKIYSDPPLNFLCTLSVFLFYVAEASSSRQKGFFFCFLSGFVIGFAYLHKVTAGYFCVMFALVGISKMVRSKKIIWRYGFLVLGFLVVFCFEMVFQYHVNHDPLFQWHVYSSQADSTALKEALLAEEKGGIQGDLKRLFWTFPLHSLLSLRLGFFYWFIFPALAYCLIRRPKDLWAPLFWWILIAILLNLSSVKGARLPFYIRQTYLISVPGVILLAQLLVDIQDWAFLSSSNAKRFIFAIFAAIAFLSLASASGILLFRETILASIGKFYILKSPILDLNTSIMLIEIFMQYILFAVLLLALFFLAMCLTAWAMERSGQKAWPARLLVISVAGFLAISSVSLAYGINKGYPNFEKDAYMVLRNLPPKTIYADAKAKEGLDFYFGFEGKERLVDFKNIQLNTIHNAYLVYNVFYKKFMTQSYDFISKHSPHFSSYPNIEADVGKDWKIIAIMHNGNLVIYDIP